VSTTIEIVRFEVSPERRAALIRGHLHARRAIRAVSPPGDLWSRLAQLDERRWLEVVAWDSRPLFERALERAPNNETARTWFDLADAGWSILTGVSPTDPPSPPPPEGELELVWSPEGEVPAAASASKPEWSIDVQLDLQAWVDPSGWIEKEPAALRVNARRQTSDRAPSESPHRSATKREVAVIASAIESAGVGGPCA
jgi:hypothetical protein